MTGYNEKKNVQTNKQTNKQNGHFLQLNLMMAGKSVACVADALNLLYKFTSKFWP